MNIEVVIECFKIKKAFINILYAFKGVSHMAIKFSIVMIYLYILVWLSLPLTELKNRFGLDEKNINLV